MTYVSVINFFILLLFRMTWGTTLHISKMGFSVWQDQKQKSQQNRAKVRQVYFCIHAFLYTVKPSSTGCLICIWTISGGCLEVTGWLKIIFSIPVKNSCKYLQMSIKYIFCDIKHGLTMTSYFWKLKYSFYTIYGLQYCGTLGHRQRKIEAMATKFSEKFTKSMLKKHRNFF